METVEFQASMVIGAGSLSIDLMKSLTDSLPEMLCPRWLATPTQRIAVDDVLEYALSAKDLPPGESRVFEIGGKDVSTYVDGIHLSEVDHGQLDRLSGPADTDGPCGRF